ncbi:hypothetical protein DFH06DRAFT_1141429 [Mycena polygramma]|nr:hypothetical protein DFH06DRAFT_1141429 [Mycena polygramma]
MVNFSNQFPQIRKTEDLCQPNFAITYLQQSFVGVLWSQTHGPVYSQEPAATLEALPAWCIYILSKPNDLTPIVASMKTDQTVFSGSEAQEATDQLLDALIHPQMPALYVCQHDITFNQLHKVFIKYNMSRMQLATSSAYLPSVSGTRPLQINQSGHIKYLQHILSYQRNLLRLDANLGTCIWSFGLFVPNAVIQPDEHAQVLGVASQTPSIPTTLRADRCQKSVEALNFAITIGKGKDYIVSYSSFFAQPGPTWWKATREIVITDIKTDINNMTLGLYSFRIFVDWPLSATNRWPVELEAATSSGRHEEDGCTKEETSFHGGYGKCRPIGRQDNSQRARSNQYSFLPLSK